jgi:hypothetical protein
MYGGRSILSLLITNLSTGTKNQQNSKGKKKRGLILGKEKAGERQAVA